MQILETLKLVLQTQETQAGKALFQRLLAGAARTYVRRFSVVMREYPEILELSSKQQARNAANPELGLANTVDTRAVARDIVKRVRWILVFSLLTRDAFTVSDLTRETGLPRSTVSRILSRLKRYGLLRTSRGLDARTTYYQVSDTGRRVAEEVRRRIKWRLTLCIEEKLENGELLDPKCVSKALARFSRDDQRVEEALLSLAGVRRKRDKLILGG